VSEAAQRRNVRYIDHVAIVVADADASSKALTNMLGLEAVNDEVVTSVGVRLVHLAGSERDRHATLQLVQPVAAGPIREYLAEHGEGLHHVCYVVDNIPAFLTSPAERGTRTFTGGRGWRACFLAAQPSGVQFELVEPSIQATVPGGAR
jgi:methylmalonyl-CoA/ethylmalonyl-CoA epimerase